MKKNSTIFNDIRSYSSKKVTNKTSSQIRYNYYTQYSVLHRTRKTEKLACYFSDGGTKFYSLVRVAM